MCVVLELEKRDGFLFRDVEKKMNSSHNEKKKKTLALNM